MSTAKDGISIASLGSQCQCFTNLTVKHFFLMNNLNISSFSLETLLLVLLLHAFVESSSLDFLQAPFVYLENWYKAFPEPSQLFFIG